MYALDKEANKAHCCKSGLLRYGGLFRDGALLRYDGVNASSKAKYRPRIPFSPMGKRNRGQAHCPFKGLSTKPPQSQISPLSIKKTGPILKMGSARPLEILAVSETAPSASRAWTPRTILPPERHIHPDDWSGWETQKTSTGKVEVGKSQTPTIYWDCKPKENEESQVYECEAVLRKLAGEFGFCYVQVLATPQTAMPVWSMEVQPDGKYHQVLWSADLHIPVRFGLAPDHCEVEGNIFLAKDKNGKLDVMLPGMRKDVVNNDDRVVQLWHWSNSDP